MKPYALIMTVLVGVGSAPFGFAGPIIELSPDACTALAKASEYAASRRDLGYNWQDDAPAVKVGLEEAMKEGSPLIQSEEDAAIVQAILELVYSSPLPASVVRWKVLEMCDPKHVTSSHGVRKLT